MVRRDSPLCSKNTADMDVGIELCIGRKRLFENK